MSRTQAIKTVQINVLARRRLQLLQAAYIAELANGSTIAARMLVKIVAS